jgi:ATP-dependent protease ClpP protease subunit
MIEPLGLDELLGMGQKNKNIFANKQIVSKHDLYLTGEIGAPDQYTDWFELIRNGGKSDIITIHINSHGGDLFTAVQLMRCIQESQAVITTSVEGACMSAATMVFLQAQSFEVSEHSAFMFHNYSGIAVGKGAEMFAQVSFEKKLVDKMMKSVYSGFLSEDEISDILEGRDLWLDGDEVVTRLKAMKKEVEQLELKLGDEDDGSEDESKDVGC